jgi:hypothetical protein
VRGHGWSQDKIRAHALRFGEEPFRREVSAFVDVALGAEREARLAC